MFLKKKQQKSRWCYTISRLYNKKNELKQIEGIFPATLMNDLIRSNLKEIAKLQDIIKKDDMI